MAKTKEKKVKEPLPEGARKLRKYFAIAFVCVAVLGVTLGILNWYGYIGVYM